MHSDASAKLLLLQQHRHNCGVQYFPLTTSATNFAAVYYTAAPC